MIQQLQAKLESVSVWLIMSIGMFIAALFLMSCSTSDVGDETPSTVPIILDSRPSCPRGSTCPPTRRATVTPESRPVGKASDAAEAAEWAELRAVSLAEAYKLTVPRTIWVHEPKTQTGVAVFPRASGRNIELPIWQSGIYNGLTKTIRVWTVNGDGTLVDKCELKAVWLHEWLHHYDWEKGIRAPGGKEHVALFTKRLEDMGLWPDAVDEDAE